MFTESADLYDLVYSFKDYPEEVERLREMVGREGGTLLDVACGTGHHLALLAEHYRVEGVDLDPAMVELTRARGLRADVGDLLTIELGRRFDVMTCLFSSIGYVADLPRVPDGVPVPDRPLARGRTSHRAAPHVPVDARRIRWGIRGRGPRCRPRRRGPDGPRPLDRDRAVAATCPSCAGSRGWCRGAGGIRGPSTVAEPRPGWRVWRSPR